MTGKNPFSLSETPMLYLEKDEAKDEARRWKTSIINEWHIDDQSEERQRAKEKEQSNDSSSEKQQ